MAALRIAERLPKRTTRCQNPVNDIEEKAAKHAVVRQPPAVLFNTESVALQPAAPLGSAADGLLAAVRRSGVLPSEPVAAALAYGPKGKQLELYHDKEGRPYRVGQLVWLIIKEQTTDGIKADKAAEAAEAAAKAAGAEQQSGGSARKRKKRLDLRRHGQRYYALGFIIRFEADGRLNATRQAPRVLVQEFLNFRMLTEYLMLSKYIIATHLRCDDAWLAGKGYRLLASATALDGHVDAEWLDEAARGAEGAPIAGALDLEQIEGQLCVTGLTERARGQAFELLGDEEQKLMPVLRPMPRSPFDASEVFTPIPTVCLGFAQAVGPILSGINAKLGWGHGHVCSGDIVTFDIELAAPGVAQAFHVRSPQAGLHPDIDYQLGRPRIEVHACPLNNHMHTQHSNSPLALLPTSQRARA